MRSTLMVRTHPFHLSVYSAQRSSFSAVPIHGRPSRRRHRRVADAPPRCTEPALAPSRPCYVCRPRPRPLHGSSPPAAVSPLLATMRPEMCAVSTAHWTARRVQEASACHMSRRHEWRPEFHTHTEYRRGPVSAHFAFEPDDVPLPRVYWTKPQVGGAAVCTQTPTARRLPLFGPDKHAQRLRALGRTRPHFRPERCRGYSGRERVAPHISEPANTVRPHTLCPRASSMPRLPLLARTCMSTLARARLRPP